MRVIASFTAFLVLAAAHPALAEAPPRLQPLDRQLAALAAANPGNIGIAALDLKTGELVGQNADTPFPMASTVKVAVAANYLAQVEHGRRSLYDTIRGQRADRLIEAMLVRSDNHATDVLLRDLGGPKTLQLWLEQNGMSGIRVDRNIAQLLRSPRDLDDVRDSATPRAMVELLRRIDGARLVNVHSRNWLLDRMARCLTGKNRLRGLLPYGTRVENKTGTLAGYASDVGFITLPDGRRLAVAVFTRRGSDRPLTIARAARTIYDGFAALWRYPIAATSSAVTYSRPQ